MWMRTVEEIEKLLEELDKSPADELEDQDLDFKEWDTKSIKDRYGNCYSNMST